MTSGVGGVDPTLWRKHFLYMYFFFPVPRWVESSITITWEVSTDAFLSFCNQQQSSWIKLMNATQGCNWMDLTREIYRHQQPYSHTDITVQVLFIREYYKTPHLSSHTATRKMLIDTFFFDNCSSLAPQHTCTPINSQIQHSSAAKVLIFILQWYSVLPSCKYM